MPAPVASGGSGRRVGLALTGKAPPCHGAHGKRTFNSPAGQGGGVRVWRRVCQRSASLLLPKLDSRNAPLPCGFGGRLAPDPDGLMKMPGSVISLFSDLDEFQAALREDGLLNLLVTGSGQFRAWLTHVTLHHLRLSAGDEYLSRIAFVGLDPTVVSPAAKSAPCAPVNHEPVHLATPCPTAAVVLPKYLRRRASRTRRPG